jgi:hypothetical protein
VNFVYSSTSSSAHLASPSWADEELAKYEAGSLRANSQESIKLERGNTANERKHIKAEKRRVKREVKKYEQTKESSSQGQR